MQLTEAMLDQYKQRGITARPGTPAFTSQLRTAAANMPPPRSYSEFYNVGSGWAMPEQTSEEAAWTNPAYNPTQNDNGYTRFDPNVYGGGLERSKNFESGARTFAAYQKLKPGQPGYDHAQGALKKLYHNFGIDNWRSASPRQLFESFDLEMRGLQEDNQKENFKFGVGDLAKLVAAAAATVATAGAAAPYFGATLGGTIATGALAGAVGATTSGVLNNNLSLKGVVTGAGIGGLLAGGQYYFKPPVVNPSAFSTASGSPSFASQAGTTAAGTSGLLRSGSSALNPSFASLGGTEYITGPALSGGINSIPVSSVGGSAANVFGALPATGEVAFGPSLSNLSGSEGVLSRFPVGYRPPPPETVSAGLYPSGIEGSVYDSGGILGGKVGEVASKVLSPSALLQASTYGSNEVPAGGGLFSGVLDQLPRAPTITYLDHAPISSGVPAQAGFERTSNIGVPSKYSSVPTELPPDTAPPPELPYGSGFDPYASTTDPNFDVSRFLGVGSLNETGQNMFRFAHGGGVGSLNETARAMPYAAGGIVRAASMVWQPFKVKIKNQAIFGDFMGYTKTGKVRVLDQESGVEKLYPKSRVRRAYSDEPLPDEPVKKVLGGALVKGAVKTLTKPKKAPKRKEYKDEFSEYEVYHGTRDDIREFNLDHPNRKDSGWLGTGVYTNTDPRIASAYSTLKRGDVGSNVMPLRARLENPYHATQAEKNRLMTISNNQGAEAGREAADAWTAELKQKGHDGVILSSGKEGHREVVVFDPKNIRSKFAQFDPAKRGSADILAATGGGIIIKGAAKVLTKKPEAPRLMLTKQNSGWYEGSIGKHAIDLDRNASPDRKEWVLKVDNEWEETFPTKRSAVEHIKKRYGASYATGGGISSLNGIARNMTRYAYGGGVGSMNEIARSMSV